MAQKATEEIEGVTTIPDEWGEVIASKQINDELWTAFAPGDASGSDIVVVHYERWEGEWEKTSVDKATIAEISQMIYNRRN